MNKTFKVLIFGLTCVVSAALLLDLTNLNYLAYSFFCVGSLSLVLAPVIADHI